MSGPMVHPSQRQPQQFQPPYQPMVQQEPEEIFCVIVSKYSPSCSTIFETVKFVSPHLHTRILEIDNPEIRQLVVESGKISMVPCIALIYPLENKMEFYEGPDALHVLNKAAEKVKQKIAFLSAQQQQAPPPQKQGPQKRSTPLQAVMDQEIPEEMDDMKSTINTRTEPSRLPPGQGHDDLGTSSLPTGYRGATEPKSSRPEADLSNSGFNFPVIDDSGLTGGSSNEGMDLESILGSNNGMANKERDRRSSSTKSKIDEIMAERDALDAKHAARNKPNI